MSSKLLKTKDIPKKWAVSLSDTAHDRIVTELEPIILAGRIPWTMGEDILTYEGEFVKVLPWQRELMDQIGVVVADTLKKHAPEFVRKVEAFGRGEIPLLSWDNFPTRGNPKTFEYSAKSTKDGIGFYNEIIPLGIVHLLNKTPFIPYPTNRRSTKEGRVPRLNWHVDGNFGEHESTNILYGQMGRKNAPTAFLLFEDLAKHPDIKEHLDALMGSNFRFNDERLFWPAFVEKDGVITLSENMNMAIAGADGDGEFITTDIANKSELVSRNQQAKEALDILSDVFIALNSRLSMDTTRMGKEEKERVHDNAASDTTIHAYATALGAGRGVMFSQKECLHARMEYSVDKELKRDTRINRITHSEIAPARQYSDSEIAELRDSLPDAIRERRIKRGEKETPSDPSKIYDEPKYRFRSLAGKKRAAIER